MKISCMCTFNNLVDMPAEVGWTLHIVLFMFCCCPSHIIIFVNKINRSNNVI
jgi:hypothetical protein